MLEFPEIELEDGGTKQDDTKQEEVEVEEGDVTIGGTAMSPKKKRGLDADGNSFSFVKRKWEARLQELANHVSITKKTKLEDGQSRSHAPRLARETDELLDQVIWFGRRLADSPGSPQKSPIQPTRRVHRNISSSIVPSTMIRNCSFVFHHHSRRRTQC